MIIDVKLHLNISISTNIANNFVLNIVTMRYSIDLKLFRKDNNLSQSNAAKLFGCDQSFISQIETGRSKIPDEYISKILANPRLNKDSIVEIEDVSTDSDRIDTLLKIVGRQTDMLKIKDLQIEKLIALLENQLNK